MEGNKQDFLLYAVTDRRWLRGKTLRHQVEAAIRGGVTMIQLREKELSARAFYQEALEIQSICRQYRVPFIINDNVELAKRIHADGVHIGQKDMGIQEARAILGPNKIIGVSAKTVEQALVAEKNGASYLGIGAVFDTGTKEDAVLISHEVLKNICRQVSIPAVAIGGITRENVFQLSGSGISGIAVVGAVFAAEDVQSAARTLRTNVEKILRE